jgi:hypothetical protein
MLEIAVQNLWLATTLIVWTDKDSSCATLTLVDITGLYP